MRQIAENHDVKMTEMCEREREREGGERENCVIAIVVGKSQIA